MQLGWDDKDYAGYHVIVALRAPDRREHMFLKETKDGRRLQLDWTEDLQEAKQFSDYYRTQAYLDTFEHQLAQNFHKIIPESIGAYRVITVIGPVFRLHLDSDREKLHYQDNEEE